MMNDIVIASPADFVAMLSAPPTGGAKQLKQFIVWSSAAQQILKTLNESNHLQTFVGGDVPNARIVVNYDESDYYYLVRVKPFKDLPTVLITVEYRRQARIIASYESPEYLAEQARESARYNPPRLPDFIERMRQRRQALLKLKTRDDDESLLGFID